MSDRLTVEASRGGANGPCLTIKLGGRYVGHFYPDAEQGIDPAALVAEMAEAWNASRDATDNRADPRLPSWA